MAAPSSGTPQSGRKRQAVAPAPVSTTAASSATPGRGGNRNGASNGSSRAASMASPRGSSLLTPEPAQKRRGVSRAATGRSAGHEGGGGGGSGNSATPTSVFTPGTGTAHLLLQLRRDWPQQQQQQQLSPSGGNAPPLPLQSGDGGGDGDEVGSTLAGQENPSEDAAALIRSCAYAVAPSGSGGHGSDSSICDKRDRPPPPSGAAAAGNTGGGGDGAAKAPRGASSSRRNDRRAPRPASCGSRRGRGSGGNSTNANGARKPALTSAAPAAGAAFSADRPGNEGVGAPAGVGSSGLVATGSGVPLGEAAAPVRISGGAPWALRLRGGWDRSGVCCCQLVAARGDVRRGNVHGRGWSRVQLQLEVGFVAANKAASAQSIAVQSKEKLSLPLMRALPASVLHDGDERGRGNVGGWCVMCSKFLQESRRTLATREERKAGRRRLKRRAYWFKILRYQSCS